MDSTPIDKRACAGLKSCIFQNVCLADPSFHAEMLRQCSVLRLSGGESFYMGENVPRLLLHVSEGVACVTSGEDEAGACVSVQYPGCTMNIPYAVSSFRPNNWFVALTDCCVVSIPFEGILGRVPGNEEVTFALFDALSDNVSNCTRYAMMVSIRKPTERVRCFLDYSRERCGTAREPLTLEIPQHMIAMATQLSRFSVSKALRELEAEGYLLVGYGSVTLAGRQ